MWLPDALTQFLRDYSVANTWIQSSHILGYYYVGGENTTLTPRETLVAIFTHPRVNR